MEPGDDDLPAPPADAAGLRAKDVLGRTEEEVAQLSRELSTAERAELESWFQRPSALVIQEQKASARREGTEAEQIEDHLTQEFDLRQKAIAAACAAVTPESIALLERHAERARRHRELVPPRTTLDPSITSLRVPAEEEMGSIAEGRHYIRDNEIEAAFEQAAPQAILRDLYRPVEEFELAYRAPPPEEDEPVYDAHQAAIEALAWRPERPSWDTMHASFADARRRFLEATTPPWSDLPTLVEELRKHR